MKKEGENINRSLLYLSNVIRNLSQQSQNEKERSYINYRDSKLTRILQNSLGGNSRTSVICTVNCLANNAAETINTLKFGVSAGQVKVMPKVNNINDRREFSSSRKRKASGDYSAEKENRMN